MKVLLEKLLARRGAAASVLVVASVLLIAVTLWAQTVVGAAGIAAFGGLVLVVTGCLETAKVTSERDSATLRAQQAADAAVEWHTQNVTRSTRASAAVEAQASAVSQAQQTALANRAPQFTDALLAALEAAEELLDQRQDEAEKAAREVTAAAAAKDAAEAHLAQLARGRWRRALFLAALTIGVALVTIPDLTDALELGPVETFTCQTPPPAADEFSCIKQ